MLHKIAKENISNSRQNSLRCEQKQGSKISEHLSTHGMENNLLLSLQFQGKYLLQIILFKNFYSIRYKSCPKKI